MKSTEEIVNETGYPFQILVEHLVKSSKDKHLWSVVSREFPYINPETNESGFIDLLQEYDGKVIRMVIECKKYSGDWVFLLPETESAEKKSAKILRSKEPNFVSFWSKEIVNPASLQSMFCIRVNEGKRDSNPLEKIARELLHSTEAVLEIENEIRRKPNSDGWWNKVYVPVIVTTANLKILSFSENDIDKSNGEIEKTKSNLDDVSYIRFTKSFSTSLKTEYASNSDIESVYRDKERTVFVVQVEHFVEFLKNFSISRLS